MTNLLTTALEAAHAAGDVLRRKFPETREVKSKGHRDVVTDADFAAQRVILDVITGRFPDHAILSEEGRHDIDLTAPGLTWVIDPLDGTTNYSRRFPYFCVSIGLADRGELQIGRASCRERVFGLV
jgi:myo-inositol-1(or 4)-monophosphatase